MNIQNRQFLQNIKGIGYGKQLDEQAGSMFPTGQMARILDTNEQSTDRRQPAPKGSGGQGDNGGPAGGRIQTDVGGETPLTDEQQLAYLIANWNTTPNAVNVLMSILGAWSNGSPPPLADVLAQVA